MDNVARQAASIVGEGLLTGTVPAGQKLPFVATKDIAAAAAQLLLDHTWTGQDAVELLGPEGLSHDDLAAVLTEALGRPVRYRRGDRAADKHALRGYGMSEAVAQALIDMDIAKQGGLDTFVPRTAENSTPMTFRRWWVADVLEPAIDTRSNG